MKVSSVSCFPPLALLRREDILTPVGEDTESSGGREEGRKIISISRPRNIQQLVKVLLTVLKCR